MKYVLVSTMIILLGMLFTLLFIINFLWDFKLHDAIGRAMDQAINVLGFFQDIANDDLVKLLALVVCAFLIIGITYELPFR